MSLISLVPGDTIMRTVVCLKNDINVKAVLSPPESQLPLVSNPLVADYIGLKLWNMLEKIKKDSA